VVTILTREAAMSPFAELSAGVDELTARWAEQRAERQTRRSLDAADFQALADAGFLRTMAPVELGGMWRDVPTSVRPLCSVLRTLAGADASVALVSAMHPAVISFWQASPDPDQPRWEDQRHAVASTARDGSQWGTVTSEPGSGGDIARTRTAAVPKGVVASPLPGETYVLTGDKHFGSGLGIADFMFTTARVEGEDDPAAYVVDVRDLDAVADALRVTAPWDGAGMAATQSHAVRLDAMPATRLAWNGTLPELQLNNGGFVLALFTAVVLGVVDAAMAEAARILGPRKDGLRAYEQTEWVRADADHWLAQAAYDRMIATIERGDPAKSLHAGLRAKLAVAELAEQILSRVGRVVGGGSYSRRSPFAYWYEDVRALGFLRPPWALTYDNVFATGWG
jgi:alkylation response protein AidB-like acyl-CoA dehydrogenase